MLPRRSEPVDALLAAVVGALPDAAGRALSWTEVGEGWDHVVYRVRGLASVEPVMLRVCKEPPGIREDVLARDVRVLALADRYATLATNRVIAADPDAGVLLLTLVEGVPVRVRAPADRLAFAATMAAFLTRLHTVPVVEVAAALGEPRGSMPGRRDQAAEMLEDVSDRLVGADLEVCRSVLGRPLPEPVRTTVFLHDDLGEDHVLLSPDGTRVAGIIDWTDAALGDPARDFALLALDVGVDVLDAMLAAYGGPADPGLRERALWYASVAAVAGVAWRLQHGLGGVEEQVTRLRRLPGQR